MAFRGTSKRLGPLWWFESGELEDYRPDRVVLRIYDRAPCQSLCCLHESEMNHGILQRFAGEEREREREAAGFIYSSFTAVKAMAARWIASSLRTRSRFLPRSPSYSVGFKGDFFFSFFFLFVWIPN